jgi:hypothetical protein
MTTHFKNGVTNVVGKDGGSSVFSGIKQPLITGGYEQEQAYQNDWQIYNASDWTATSTGGSDFQLAEYAGGWLRQGDNAPAAGEIQGIAGPEVWQYNQNQKWWFETSIAITDVSELNTWVGFAQDGYADSDTLPTDGIGFSHLQDTTTIQFISRKNGAGVSFDMLDTAGGSTFTMLDSTIATQTATVQAIPANSVRLGFQYQPAGSEVGVTANQFKLYLNGNPIGTQAATTVPDDIALEMNIMCAHKGTVANHLVVDYFNTFQSRVAGTGVSA